MIRLVDPDRLRAKIALAATSDLPLFMLILATKPCYVKLSPLIREAVDRGSPMVIIDTGHHFDEELLGAGKEADIGPDIDVFMDLRGTMLGRTSQLASRCEMLADMLAEHGASLASTCPVVSGDTSTSATFPLFWYLRTGARCIHVEAGLRSRSPWKGSSPTIAEIRAQRSEPWTLRPDEPFPEAVDTRVTSIVARRLYAPLDVNRSELLREGYDPSDVAITGSLSADAVARFSAGRTTVEETLSRRVRIDVHRRENMTLERLTAITDAARYLSADGWEVSFVMTNQIKAAFEKEEFGHLLARLRSARVHCEAIMPSYVGFLALLADRHWRMVLTDSGGLQEETAILRIPCCILRHSTDRPETVRRFGTAALTPPSSGRMILDAIDWFLGTYEPSGEAPYGEGVSRRMLADMDGLLMDAGNSKGSRHHVA